MPAIQAQLAEWFSFQKSDWEVFVSETLAANPALFTISIEKLTRAFPNEFRTLDTNQPYLNEKDMAHTHLKSRTKYLRVCKNKEAYICWPVMGEDEGQEGTIMPIPKKQNLIDPIFITLITPHVSNVDPYDKDKLCHKRVNSRMILDCTG